MDGEKFDRLVRACAGLSSRRALLRGLVAGAAAVAAAADPMPGLARRCHPLGRSCRQASDCCSQTCNTAPHTQLHHRCVCPSGWSDCDHNPANGCETYTYGDPNNCGACGHACPTGSTCGANECFCFGTICGGVCFNTFSDVNNCGGCGNACAAGETCCDGRCANTQTDSGACGGCGYSCENGAICAGGACVCPSGTTLCHGSDCVDVLTDLSNCGTCGNVCPTGASCSNGSCACPDGFVPCDRACVAGSCACPGGAAVCADGYCPGPNYAHHCGSCDVDCPGGYGCACGACQLACSGGNGCYVGRPECCAGEECVAAGPFSGGGGVCECLCPPGLSHCFGSTCYDLSSDPANCGGCGIDCGGGECIGGACGGATPVAG